MIIYKFLTIIVISVCLINCKNKTEEQPKVDPILQEALSIQDEAIHIGIELDSILDARMAEGSYAQNIDSLRLLKSAVNDWRYNMVEIPGVEHDHDHSGHDHDHSHDHSASEAASHLTPADLKKVQLEWKAAIEAIRTSIK
jgi:ABC-type Zn2+ transport system substrate-binding protein/surface adhesin